MNMTTKTIYIFFAAILSILILFNQNAAADTITLKDGTYLIGKVTKTTKDELIFKNFFGVFTIKKSHIKKLYITKNYKEDIRIGKELGQTIDEKEIKKQVLAGLEGQKKEEEKNEREKEKATKEEPEKESGAWTGGRISLMGGYLRTATTSDGSTAANGFSALISYDQGPDGLFGLKRHFYMPGFHLEGGYINFPGDQESIYGFTCSAGPLWLIPFINDAWGNIAVSLLPGASFLKTTDEFDGTSTWATSFSLYTTLGYEYSFGDFAMFIQGRYLYMNSESGATHDLGVFAGASYSLW
ncbi:MAG: hypothetical protein GY754_39255 [bacterium]|nr:hypothetical protein [bacterium]